MSIAERTRGEARKYPFLVEALRARILNYTAAARFLDIGDIDAVAAALRRFADEVSTHEPVPGDVRLRMITGIGPTTDRENELLAIGDRVFAPESGDLTAIVADGHISMRAVTHILWQITEYQISVYACAFDEDRLIVTTDRNEGPAVLRIVEETLVPNSRD